MKKLETTSNQKLSKMIQSFFCEYLISQRKCSKHTVDSYRDTFRLLLIHAEHQLNKKVSKLSIDDFDAKFVIGFLNSLENERKNTIKTRNLRLAAIHSFLNYISIVEPSAGQQFKEVLSIPMKKFERYVVDFLTREEINAILCSPNIKTWSGARDQVMFNLLYNTGARIFEVINLKLSDIDLTEKSIVKLHGKGRKDRCIPLWKETIKLLRSWLPKLLPVSNDILLPNRFGQLMTRTGAEYRLKKALKVAIQHCPSLARKRVTPHVIRHTTAVHLLQSGVDLSVTAIWLGHENINTTHQYINADLAMKDRALDKFAHFNTQSLKRGHLSTRYTPSMDILKFLDSL